MNRFARFYGQLKKRRVIRAAVIYLAAFWLLLQVADLFAESGFLGSGHVQALIIAGLMIFPLILVLAWLYEHPWHGRRWPGVVGDMAVLLTVSVAVALLAWQQWHSTFTRPTLAVLGFEATDTREGSPELASHLASRMYMLLASVPAIRVIDPESSGHPLLAGLPIEEKARVLGADFLVSGTVNQTDRNLRLNLQLFSGSGELLWGDRFSDRLVDQQNLQIAALRGLWPRLDLAADELDRLSGLVMACEYPLEPGEVIRIADLEAQLQGRTAGGIGSLDRLITALNSLLAGPSPSGLAYLLRARARWLSLNLVAPKTRSVTQQLAMRDLEEAHFICPGHPDIAGLRARLTPQFAAPGADRETLLARLPNNSHVRLQLAHNSPDDEDPDTTAQRILDAYQLNPLNREAICLATGLRGTDFFPADQLMVASTVLGGGFHDISGLCAVE